MMIYSKNTTLSGEFFTNKNEKRKNTKLISKNTEHSSMTSFMTSPSQTNEKQISSSSSSLLPPPYLSTDSEVKYHEQNLEQSQISTGTKISSAFYILSVIPAMALTYIQIIFNVVMLGFVLNGVTQFYFILQNDLTKHMGKQQTILLSDIVQCSRDYVRNSCGTSTSAPALEQTCNNWKICMEQDLDGLLHTKESAVVLAQVLNNFFGSLDDKTIYCFCGMLFGSIILTNLVITWCRRT